MGCSIPFGIWLCVNCAAVHRRMGTHISFVRSSILDRWNQDQLMHMMVGGNRKAYSYFKQHGWMEENADKRTAKFTSKAAVQYKQQIKKIMSQQRIALLSQINSKPQPKGPPKLPSGFDGLDALMGEIKDENAKAAASNLYNPKKNYPKPKPQISQNNKPITSSLKAKIKPPASARRVIITKKSKERKSTSRIIRPKANPRKSRLTTSSGISSRRSNLTISRGKTSSTDADLDAALSSLKIPSSTPVKSKIIEPVVKEKVDQMKEYEEEQRQRKEEENRRKDDLRLNKYTNSKSISSDQYFERGDWAATSLQDKMRLEKFSSAGSISSDAFFEREDAKGNGSTTYDALSSAVGYRGRQLSGLASGLYNSVKSRYNQSG